MTRHEAEELLQVAIAAFLFALFMAVLVGLGYVWRDQSCMTTAKIAEYMRGE